MRGLLSAEVLASAVRMPDPTDPAIKQVAAAAEEVLVDWLGGGDHVLHARCREAALAIGVQIWQQRRAPGGQVVGGDLGLVTPQLLGPGLVRRIDGLVGSCRPVGLA